MSVSPKVTHCHVRPSGDPQRPITVAFLYEGPGRDQPKEGWEMDMTTREATEMAEAIRVAVGMVGR